MIREAMRIADPSCRVRYSIRVDSRGEGSHETGSSMCVIWKFTAPHAASLITAAVHAAASESARS